MHAIDTFSHTLIILMAKAPIAGRVKTRMIPALGEQGACDLYESLLDITLLTMSGIDNADLAIYWDGAMDDEFLLRHQHSCVEIKPQHGNDLGERMLVACRDNIDRYHSVVLIGADCPILNAQHINTVINHLQSETDVVITPAEDGGYVLLGMNEVYDTLFEDIIWSSESVFQQTRDKLNKLSVRWKAMPELWDIDREQDLRRWQSLQADMTQQRLP